MVCLGCIELKTLAVVPANAGTTTVESLKVAGFAKNIFLWLWVPDRAHDRSLVRDDELSLC
jgi:hypothetical protein